MSRPFSPLNSSRGPAPYYDVVVIGSGIGGLVCANLLAGSGLKVLIIEQHTMVGGYCSGFRRKGFLFDSASHFYPLLGNPNSISGRILSEIGSPTRWVKMDPVDQFHLPDGSRFSVPADFGSYLRQLQLEFPDEIDAIDKFFLTARKLYLWGLLHFFEGCESDRLRPYLTMTVRDALNQYFVSEKLKLLLTADCPHWGSTPSQTSFIFDSLLRLSYFEGNYFPVGGSQKFADDLAGQFQLRGGEILMNSLVRSIVVSNDQATHLEIESGKFKNRTNLTIHANQIVSNADMRQTVFDMVGEEFFPTDFIDHIKKLEPSFSCFLSHIGLRDVPSQLLEDVHGYYWNAWDSDRVGSDAFQFKLFAPTLYDPTLAPPGGQVLIVQKVVDQNYDSVTDWHASKRQIEQFVLNRLDRIIPGFRNKIVVCESASAHTSHRFTLNYQGAMLGWRMSPNQLGVNRPAVESPIRNLYFVGQWTRPGGGITPAIVSAMNVARKITGERCSRSSFLSTRPKLPVSRFMNDVEVAR
ncbi:MAG: NAD(P)/FAD-dependent oxidoreductase [Pirellula sp.]